jgi:hypoxanthine phosphoribosyltransferase
MSEFYPTSLEEHNYSESGGKVRYSYDEIHDLVRGGASMLREAKFQPDYIISIAGGGLIPARMLRSYLDVPILNMTVSSYEGDSQTPIQDPVIREQLLEK